MCIYIQTLFKEKPIALGNFIYKVCGHSYVSYLLIRIKCMLQIQKVLNMTSLHTSRMLVRIRYCANNPNLSGLQLLTKVYFSLEPRVYPELLGPLLHVSSF